MPKLIDVHTHTQFAAFAGDYAEVIQRALDKGIWLVNAGTQRDTSARAVEIAESYREGVYATIALHPIHTEKSHHDFKELGEGEEAKAFISRGEDFDYGYYLELGRSEKVVGVGECGLDYYRLEAESQKRQETALVSQIKLAKDLGKPLIIHCRNAFADLIAILKRERELLLDRNPGVIHFFTGTPREAEEIKEMGFYFSFGGVITFARDYDQAIKSIGLERVLLETDAPYVAPAPYRGKRNEPAYVSYVAEKMAEIFGISSEEASAVTTANARKVLRI
ncbi:MAG: TatD family hydrolase [Patescibacteria group bacterium]|nr:TatD family hydrolase [Patescibacteria group bacterium]MCL5224387.1 TatD family hydrolase [Patescibacteria group bacterium]